MGVLSLNAGSLAPTALLLVRSSMTGVVSALGIQIHRSLVEFTWLATCLYLTPSRPGIARPDVIHLEEQLTVKQKFIPELAEEFGA
jgi:hypothetical protein